MAILGNVITKIFRSVKTERPEIVCLCGSSRFYDEYQQAYYDLTMQGHIVLSIGFYPHAKAEHGHGEGIGHDSAQNFELDELHKRKIDLADWVLVLNVGGYIGSSTQKEIRYAQKYGRPVRYLNPVVPFDDELPGMHSMSDFIGGATDAEYPQGGYWEAADFTGGGSEDLLERLRESFDYRTGDDS